MIGPRTAPATLAAMNDCLQMTSCAMFKLNFCWKLSYPPPTPTTSNGRIYRVCCRKWLVFMWCRDVCTHTHTSFYAPLPMWTKTLILHTLLSTILFVYQFSIVCHMASWIRISIGLCNRLLLLQRQIIHWIIAYFFINWVFTKLQWNLNQNTDPFIQEHALKCPSNGGHYIQDLIT